MATLKTQKFYAKLLVILCGALLLACGLSSSVADSPKRGDIVYRGADHVQYNGIVVENAVISNNTALEAAIAWDDDGCEVALLDGAIPLPISTGSHKYYYANSGNTLRSVVQTLRKQKYESAVGFNVVGEKLYDYTNLLPSKNYANSAHRQEFMRNGGTIAIHNHPSSCPFSAQDLYAESKFGTPIVMVVSDRYVYTVQPLSGRWGNPGTLQKYYSDQINRYTSEALAYMKSVDYGYSPTRILTTARPDDGSFKWFYENEIRRHLLSGKNGNAPISGGIWAMDKAMRKTAQQFNLLYTRDPTDQFNYNDPLLFIPVVDQNRTQTCTVTIAMPPRVFGGKCCIPH